MEPWNKDPHTQYLQIKGNVLSPKANLHTDRWIFQGLQCPFLLNLGIVYWVCYINIHQYVFVLGLRLRLPLVLALCLFSVIRSPLAPLIYILCHEPPVFIWGWAGPLPVIPVPNLTQIAFLDISGWCTSLGGNSLPSGRFCKSGMCCCNLIKRKTSPTNRVHSWRWSLSGKSW